MQAIYKSMFFSIVVLCFAVDTGQATVPEEIKTTQVKITNHVTNETFTLDFQNDCKAYGISKEAKNLSNLAVSGKRILMLPTRLCFLNPIAEMFADPETMKFYAKGGTYTSLHVKGRIESHITRHSNGDPFVDYVILKNEILNQPNFFENGKFTFTKPILDKLNDYFIGRFTLGHGEKEGECELSTIIKHSLWKQGYGTEARGVGVDFLAQKLKKAGFQVPFGDSSYPLTRILSTNHPNNKWSIRINENLGLTKIAETTTKYTPDTNKVERVKFYLDIK